GCWLIPFPIPNTPSNAKKEWSFPNRIPNGRLNGGNWERTHNASLPDIRRSAAHDSRSARCLTGVGKEVSYCQICGDRLGVGEALEHQVYVHEGRRYCSACRPAAATAKIP